MLTMRHLSHFAGARKRSLSRAQHCRLSGCSEPASSKKKQRRRVVSSSQKLVISVVGIVEYLQHTNLLPKVQDFSGVEVGGANFFSTSSQLGSVSLASQISSFNKARMYLAVYFCVIHPDSIYVHLDALLILGIGSEISTRADYSIKGL